MAWFKRKEKGITTATEDKMDIPKGLWYKSPTGKIIDADELARNLFVSPEDGFHVRIGSAEYFQILFDNNEFVELINRWITYDKFPWNVFSLGPKKRIAQVLPLQNLAFKKGKKLFKKCNREEYV